MKKLEERREKKQAKVDRCADLRGMLYEDMKDGIISKEDYKAFALTIQHIFHFQFNLVNGNLGTLFPLLIC